MGEYGCYFEVLIQMTLKRLWILKLTDFNHVAVDETIKKHTILTTMSSQKRTQILLNYFIGLYVSWEKLDKLHKKVKKILKNKDMDVEDKIEILYDIET